MSGPKAGLDAAREEGRIGGRRPKLTPQQQVEIRKIVSKGDKTARRRGAAVQDPSGHRQQASCPDAASASKAKHAK